MRNIPDDNLAYPVLITLDNGSAGSGFHLNTGTQVYLVTAKHVLFDSNSDLMASAATLKCPSRDLADTVICSISVDLSRLMAEGKIFSHDTKDVAAVQMADIVSGPGGGLTFQPVDGVVTTTVAPSGIVTVDLSSTNFLDRVLISNDVVLYGYPSSLGLKQSPQFDYDQPLLRKGIVASVNLKEGTVILDCPVYYGNSGGPVVQIETETLGRIKHNIIGVVSQFIPYSETWINQSNGIEHIEISNSGYSVAVAMDYVFEMLGLAKP